MKYPFTVIGESLNASIPSVREAVINNDEKMIKDLAATQAECGAHMLDVNASVAGRNEAEDLVWMVRVVQSAVNLPLVLDSSNPEALRAALEIYEGPSPIISSITGEMSKGHETLLSLAVEHQCGLVGMCMDSGGISQDHAKRFMVADSLTERVVKAGVKPENFYIDPLVMALSTDTNAGQTLLSLLRMLKDQIPDVHTLCGLSNVSYGMPSRKLLNHTFISMVAAYGMDSFLVNVRDRRLMSTFYALSALMGFDEWSMKYIRAYRSGSLEA